jgi:hypothetical protein
VKSWMCVATRAMLGTHVRCMLVRALPEALHGRENEGEFSGPLNLTPSPINSRVKSEQENGCRNHCDANWPATAGLPMRSSPTTPISSD